MLTGLRSGYSRLPVFGFELDEADVAEVRAVGQPERSVRWDRERRPDRSRCCPRRHPTRRPGRRPPTCSPANRDRASCRRAGRSRPSAACPARSSRRSTCRPSRMTSGAQVLLPPRAMHVGPRTSAGNRLHQRTRRAATSSRRRRRRSAGRRRWRRRRTCRHAMTTVDGSCMPGCPSSARTGATRRNATAATTLCFI